MDKKLIEAVKQNNIERVQLLLEAGANPNVREIKVNGITPLMFALMDDNEEIVKLLLKYGADPNTQSFTGNTALIYALDNPKLFELLLKNGANPNLQNRIGSTISMIAIRDGKENLVKLLIKYGADLSIRDIYGKNVYDIIMYEDNGINQEEKKGLFDTLKNYELQIAQKHKRQIQHARQGKHMTSGLIETLPRQQVPLRGGRYIYPGGISYMQAAARSGLDTTGIRQGYPQGYQQFWRTYQGEDEMMRRLRQQHQQQERRRRQSQGGAGPSGSGGYSLRSPRKVKKSVKKSVRKSIRRR
jgi:hypothetical protein